jgi:energy-coupling factor transporter ATP-binding protein EcfA2
MLAPGQKQRLGLARALILRPKVIIADEALASLDMSMRSQLINLMLELQEKQGIAYIYVTQHLGMMKHISEHTAILKSVSVSPWALSSWQDELILAYSTASSESVLPRIIEKMEAYGAPASITSFVVPTGYSFNLDGSTLYQSIAAIFIAKLFSTARRRKLNFVRRTQVGYCNTFTAFTLTLRLHVRAVHALVAHYPGERTAFFTNRLLQQHQCLHVSFRTRRAAWDVNIHRDKLIYALHDRINVVHTAGVCTSAHGDNPFRLQHLVIKTLNDRRHLGKTGPCHHHQVSLTWGSTQYLCAKTRNVMHRSE